MMESLNLAGILLKTGQKCSQLVMLGFPEEEPQMFNQVEIIYFTLIPDCDSYKARFCYNTRPDHIRHGLTLYAGFIYMA